MAENTLYGSSQNQPVEQEITDVQETTPTSNIEETTVKPVVEVPSEAPSQAPSEAPSTMKDLYKTLVKTKDETGTPYYTASFDEFKDTYSNKKNIDFLYKTIKEDNLSDEDEVTFYNKYFSHVAKNEANKPQSDNEEEQTPIQKAEKVQNIDSEDPPSKRLWEKLKSIKSSTGDPYFNGTYDDFNRMFSDKESVNKLFTTIRESGLLETIGDGIRLEEKDYYERFFPDFKKKTYGRVIVEPLNVKPLTSEELSKLPLPTPPSESQLESASAPIEYNDAFNLANKKINAKKNMNNAALMEGLVKTPLYAGLLATSILDPRALFLEKTLRPDYSGVKGAWDEMKSIDEKLKQNGFTEEGIDAITKEVAGFKFHPDDKTLNYLADLKAQNPAGYQVLVSNLNTRADLDDKTRAELRNAFNNTIGIIGTNPGQRYEISNKPGYSVWEQKETFSPPTSEEDKYLQIDKLNNYIVQANQIIDANENITPEDKAKYKQDLLDGASYYPYINMDTRSAKDYLSKRMSGDMDLKDPEKIPSSTDFSGRTYYTDLKTKDFQSDPDLDKYTVKSIREHLSPTRPVDRAIFDVYVKRRAVNEAFDQYRNDPPKYFYSEHEDEGVAQAAINYYRSIDENFDRDYNSVNGNLDKKYVGSLVYRFINDPYVYENSNNRFSIQQARKNFSKDFPEFATATVGHKLSQYAEDYGYNDGIVNSIVNIPTQSRMDEVANKMIESGELTQDEYNTYKNNIRDDLDFWSYAGRFGTSVMGWQKLNPNPIETSDFLGKAAEGFSGVMQSNANTIEWGLNKLATVSPGSTGVSGWSDDAHVARILDEGIVPKLEPTKTHAAIGGIGQFTGFVVGMVGMSSVFKAMGVSKMLAHDIAAAETFWGNNYYQAAKDHPGNTTEDNLLKYGQALTGTGIDVVFTKLLPTNKIFKSIQKELKGDYADLLKKVSTGAITGEEASKTIMQKAGQLLSGTVISSGKTGATLSVLEALHEINNNVFTGKAVDVSEVASNAIKSLIPNTLSSVLVSAAGAKADINAKGQAKNAPLSYQNVYDMASRPGLYEYHIDKMEKQGVDPAIVNDYRTNLKTIADAKAAMDSKEFDNLTEEQKKKFVGITLLESVASKKALETQDPTLSKKYAETSNGYRMMKERILDSKDKAEELKKAEGGEEVPFDEKKAGEEIPDIVQQLKGWQYQIDEAKKTLQSDPNNSKAQEDLDFYQRQMTLFNQDPVGYTQRAKEQNKETLDEALAKGTSKEDLGYDKVLSAYDNLINQSKLYGEKYQSGISGILGKGEATEQTQSQQAAGPETTGAGGVLQTQEQTGGIEKSSPEAQEKVGSPEKTVAALQGLPEDQSTTTVNINGEELPIKGNEQKIAEAYHEGTDINLKNKVDEIFGIRTEAKGAVSPETQVPQEQKIFPGIQGGVAQAGGVTTTGAPAVPGGLEQQKAGATIPFEITTYVEGQHKQEYEAAVNRLIEDGVPEAEAHERVVQMITEDLKAELPKILQSEGVKAQVIKISDDNGGYTNTETNQYDLSPNIVVELSEGTSTEDVNSTMHALNVGADQQSANAFMEATPEEIASGHPDVHGVFFFEKPQKMSKEDFGKMMVELNGIKDADGNSVLTGHTPFGGGLIGIGGHFYGKKFVESVQNNIDKINSVLSKYGVDLSSTAAREKKILTYDKSRENQANGSGQKSSISEKDRRIIQKTRDLYSNSFKSISEGKRSKPKPKSEKAGEEAVTGKETVTGKPSTPTTEYQAGQKPPASVPEQVITPIVKRVTRTIQRLFGKPDSKITVLTGDEWSNALEKAMNGEAVSFQAFGGFEKKGFEETDEYKKLKAEGKIIEGFDIRNLAGKNVVVINPDNMITGVIVDKNGKPIVNGNGGINFVSKFGDVWASSDAKTADQLVEYINEAVGKDIANGGDGKVHIIVTKGSLSKSLTSHTGAKAAMSVLESMVDNDLISLSNFRKALINAGKKYDIDFNGKNDAKSIHNDIANKFFGLSDSSFEQRGFFIKDVIDALSENMNSELDKAKSDLSKLDKGTKEYKDQKKKVEDIKKSIDDKKEKIREYLNSKDLGRKIDFKSEGIIDAMGLLFSDNMTVGVPGSHAYATIEVSGKVRSIETSKEEGGHESYPFHIKQVNGERPVLNILSSNDHITDIVNDKNNNPVPREIPRYDKNGNPVYKKDGTPQIQSGANKLGSNQIGMSKAIVKSEENLPSKNKANFMSDSKGEVYGFEQNGNIILNGDKINANTAVHEPAHIWISWAEQNRPDLHESGLEKIKGSKYLEDVKNDEFYKEQASKLPEDQREAYYQKEALAKAIGDQGEKFVTEAQKASFKSWVLSLWRSVIKNFGIQNMSAEDVSKMTLDEFSKKVAADIFEGKEGKEGTAKKEEEKGKEKEEPTGISKEELEKKYNFTKTFDTRGDQQVADEAMNNLSESAKKNNVSIDEQAENDVALMKYKKGTVSEQDIMTAAYHLKSLDAQIKAKVDAGEDASFLMAKRDAALETLRMLGNNAGRNLRLFSVAYRKVEEGKLEATRAQIAKSIGVPEVPKTMKELNASKMSEVDKATVKPYVEAIEKLNKDLADIDKTATENIEKIDKAQLEDYIKKEIQRRIESGEIKVNVSKREKTLGEKGADLADKIKKLKIDTKKLGDGGAQSNIAGVPLFIYNGLIDLVAASVSKGATLAEAISLVLKDPKNLDNKYKVTEQQLQDYVLKGLDISEKKDEAINSIKKIAEKDKVTTLTPEMVDANLVNNIVNSIIHSETPYDKVVPEATEQLKEILPDVTEQDVSDAILRKGAFKKKSKKQVIQEIEDKKKDLKRVIVSKNKLAALEAGANAGSAVFDNSLSSKQKKDAIEKRKSDYEKSVDKKIKEINEKKKEAADQARQAEADAKKAEAAAKKEKERKAELEEKLRKIKAGEKIEPQKKSEPKKESDEIEQLKKEIADASKDAKEAKRVQELKDKLALLESGKRPEPKAKGEKKVESPEVEALKEKIAEADANLRKIESEQKAAQNSQKRLNDKIASLNEEINFVNQNKAVFQRALKDPKKANEEIKALKDDLAAAYNQAGIRIESGSKNEIKIAQDAEAEINAIKESDLPEDIKKRDIKEVEQRRDDQIRNTKQGVLTSLKDNIDGYFEELNNDLNNAIANGDKETEASLRGVIDKLKGLSDLSGKLSPNIENLKDQIDKADQRLSELIEETAGTTMQGDIKDIQEKFQENWQATSDEMQRQSLIDKAERDLKEAERRMNAGQYTEIPTNKFDAKRDEEVSIKQARAQKAWKQLNGMAMKAKEKQQQQGIVSKWLKLRRDFMIMSFGAIEKVAGSSVTKPIIDPLIRQTFGRISGAITGIKPASLKKIGMTYGQQFRTQESANKFVEATNDDYIAALDEHENNVKKYGEDSKEAAQSKEKLDAAELQKEFATAYLFINANSAVDIAQVMVNGATDFDAKMGKSRQSFASERTKLEGMYYWIESINRTHGAMKSVSQRQALLDDYMENLQYVQDKDGFISMDRRQQAWDLAVLRSEVGRFGEETQMSSAIGQMKGSESGAKRNVANYLFPVAKVGINITKQGIDMAFPGFELLGKAFRDGNIKRGIKINEQEGKIYNNSLATFYNGIKKGYEELPLQQKKYINTLITRGLFGLAQYATVGYLLSSGAMQYGGAYNPYDRKKKIGPDGKPLEHGEWVIGGVRMPEIFNMVFNHSPYCLPASIATSAYQNSKEGEYYKAVTGTINEVYERLPVAAAVDIVGALTGDKFKFEKAVAAEVPVPGFSKNIAEYMDKDEEGNVRPVKIYTDGVWETISNIVKSKIPGLRSTLETKPELFTDKQAESYPNIVKLQSAGIMLPDIGAKKFEVAVDKNHPDGKLSESEMKTFLGKLRDNYNAEIGSILNSNWKGTSQKTGEIVYSLGEGLAKFKGDKQRATSELQEMSSQALNTALTKTYEDMGLTKAPTTEYKWEKVGNPLFTKEDINSSEDLKELVSKGFELPSVPSIDDINSSKDIAVPLTKDEYETFKQIMKKEINDKLKLMFTSAYRHEEFSPELQRQMYGGVQIGGQLMNVETKKEDGTKSNLFQDKFDESISGIKNEVLKKMGKLKPKVEWKKAN